MQRTGGMLDLIYAVLELMYLPALFLLVFFLQWGVRGILIGTIIYLACAALTIAIWEKIYLPWAKRLCIRNYPRNAPVLVRYLSYISVWFLLAGTMITNFSAYAIFRGS